ncbi:hypothetical protein I3843_15G001500 [Carya illinoinensis]|uniref:Uncharacterized protein n=1 Tax=Carya illinoinensis TaxID=32201 RepID=A0A922A2H1_CARIL|nr:hypothetical protein I3760_15G001800 [Carya illinoinensis]KAG6673654.1 hypothetical protein I3842_15G001800 [Carya illinoinensis]KAG7942726.1 hypothetical protein I3843_15G001500 [Carya illinoinensis]
MASSSFSSKSSNLRRNTLCLILVFLVINGSCTATRPGVTIMVDSTRTLKEKHRTAFQYHGQVFSFFPKGTPLSPSGPSKRHNSVVHSTQN